jgi:hypothetical protein
LSSIAKELEMEIREKKRTARGVHSRKGKRGYVGRMLFPSDMMSRKDKYNHRKAGKCIVTNVRDEIISRDKFKLLPQEEQVKLLTHWRDKYNTDEIIAGLGIAKGTYYQLASDLGVSKKYNKTNTTKKKEKAPKAIAVAPEPTHPEVIQETQLITRLQVVDGLALAYRGEYTAEEIIKRLDKIGLMLSDEESKFEVEIKIRELA